MTEDVELESFVKAALEDGAGVGREALSALTSAAEREAEARRARRSFFRFGAPVLLAASLTVALAIRVTVFGLRDGEFGSSEVKDAIGLLSALDGVETEIPDDATDGERLLAWQEAPCADLL